jgi:hypothetical protein
MLIPIHRSVLWCFPEPAACIGVTGGGHLVLGSPEVFVGAREWIDTKTMVKRHSGTARK